MIHTHGHAHTHTHTLDAPKVDFTANKEDEDKGAETEPARAVSASTTKGDAYIVSSQEAGVLEHQVRGIKALVHHASGMPLLKVSFP